MSAAKALALAKIAMHREALLQGAPIQNHLADWWARLLVQDRRTLLALAGLDDSDKAARRPWLQLLEDHRQAILSTAGHLVRVCKPVAWA